jgi:hypothetical protein
MKENYLPARLLCSEATGHEERHRHEAVSTRDAKYGATPLHFAVWGGNAEQTRRLIDWEADLTAKDKDGQTPWAWAILPIAWSSPTLHWRAIVFSY